MDTDHHFFSPSSYNCFYHQRPLSFWPSAYKIYGRLLPFEMDADGRINRGRRSSVVSRTTTLFENHFGGNWDGDGDDGDACTGAVAFATAVWLKRMFYLEIRRANGVDEYLQRVDQ